MPNNKSRNSGLRETHCVQRTHIVIQEGEDPYFVFAGEKMARNYAARRALENPGTHWLVFSPVCGFTKQEAAFIDHDKLNAYISRLGKCKSLSALIGMNRCATGVLYNQKEAKMKAPSLLLGFGTKLIHGLQCPRCGNS